MSTGVILSVVIEAYIWVGLWLAGFLFEYYMVDREDESRFTTFTVSFVMGILWFPFGFVIAYKIWQRRKNRKEEAVP
jgi:hypothetical protein